MRVTWARRLHRREGITFLGEANHCFFDTFSPSHHHLVRFYCCTVSCLTKDEEMPRLCIRFSIRRCCVVQDVGWYRWNLDKLWLFILCSFECCRRRRRAIQQLFRLQNITHTHAAALCRVRIFFFPSPPIRTNACSSF